MLTDITEEKSSITHLSPSTGGEGGGPTGALLRFITAGSVDDGKSTLIGRLLYDSKSIMIDQLEAIQAQTKNREAGEIDLALLTDGLRAEREQGITIDVAYKYFNTPRRKFIIADAPGHIQYTRNMFTGASTANLIIILIDVRNGVIEQTRRHSIIASLLGIPHMVVAVNKIDLADYSEAAFNKVAEQYKPIAESLGLKDVTYIPISAALGDNIVNLSDKTPWYRGISLLEHLETVEVDSDINHTDARFQVQYVLRPQTEELHDYRGYAGKIISGQYSIGDSVTILPAGIATTIRHIEVAGKEAETTFAGQPAVLHLTDKIDVSRGDAIVKSDNLPQVSNELEAILCWMDSNKSLTVGSKYLIQHNSRRVKAIVKEIQYKLDVNTLQEEKASGAVLNDVVKVKLKTASPLVFDAYTHIKANGAAILIDETSNTTAAAVLLSPLSSGGGA